MINGVKVGQAVISHRTTELSLSALVTCGPRQSGAQYPEYTRCIAAAAQVLGFEVVWSPDTSFLRLNAPGALSGRASLPAVFCAWSGGHAGGAYCKRPAEYALSFMSASDAATLLAKRGLSDIGVQQAGKGCLRLCPPNQAPAAQAVTILRACAVLYPRDEARYDVLASAVIDNDRASSDIPQQA